MGTRAAFGSALLVPFTSQHLQEADSTSHLSLVTKCSPGDTFCICIRQGENKSVSLWPEMCYAKPRGETRWVGGVGGGQSMVALKGSLSLCGCGAQKRSAVTL